MSCYKISRILSTDGLDAKGIQVLRDSGIEVVEQKLNKSDLIKELVNFDGIIVRSATIIDAEIIRNVADHKNNKLKVIARAGTGVDNIDVNAATEKGILVINTPAANTISAAEHTCALMSSLSRQIPQAHLSMKQGKWDRKLFMGSELMNKTLAIIGLGRIGKEVATRAQAFGMKTIGFDPIIDAEEAQKFNVQWLQINQLWPLADYITVHVPLIPQTENLINSKTFEMCKSGVKVINCARGGIINEADLLSALESGKCSGAALDVFLEEPPSLLKLIKHPNLISTPHLGASTVEAQYRVSMEIAENIIALSTDNSLAGSINGSILEILSLKEVENWKLILEKISHLCLKCDDINLFYDTNVKFCSSKTFETFIKNYLAMTLLSMKFENLSSINLINANILANEKNLKINLKKTERQISSDENGLILQVNDNLLKLVLIKNKLFLSKFNSVNMEQPILLEGPGTLIITKDQMKSTEILMNLMKNGKLKSYSYQEKSSFYILISKGLDLKIAENVDLITTF